jgi:hypothetical protein
VTAGIDHGGAAWETWMDVLAYLLADDDWVEGQSAIVPDPARLGGRMAGLYRRWAGPEDVDLTAITDGFLQRLGCDDSPVGQACRAAANAVTQWGGHPYHSVQHHAEVATNAMVITELVRPRGPSVTPDRRALLLAGCLAHDLYYDPHAAVRPRFAAELESAHALNAIAERCGVSAAERTELTCLILATEPGFRSSLASVILGQPHPDMPPGLQWLTADPSLATLAAIISDADLLSSFGLTQDWHQFQVQRLQNEIGRNISPQEDLRFLDGIVGADFLSPGGRMFSPNLARLRQNIRNAGAVPAMPGQPQPRSP